MDDFEAKLAAKVATLDEAETTTEETPAEAENVEEEVATEVEAIEEQVEEAQKPEPQRKFTSWEEAEKAYENAQKALGRQGEELGELRKAVEEVQRGQQQPQAYGKLQEALEENPQAVAMWALQQGNEEVLDQALEYWYEESPRAAARFERAIEMAQFKQEFEGQIVPALENVKSESEVRALALAQRELRAKYPDFDQVMESVEESDVEGLNQDAIRQLRDADPKAALEVVYRWVAAGKKVQEAVAGDERKAEALEEKRKAFVASSTSSPVEGTKSAKEQLKEFFLTPDAHSVHHGLVRD